MEIKLKTQTLVFCWPILPIQLCPKLQHLCFSRTPPDPNVGQCSVLGPWPHTLSALPSLTVSSLLGTHQERNRAGVSQNRQDQHCEKKTQSMENILPAPCWKHTKRRRLIPSDWSCLRRATGASPASAHVWCVPFGFLRHPHKAVIRVTGTPGHPHSLE